MVIRAVVLIVISFLFLGCEEEKPETIYKTVDTSIKAEEKAVNSDDWVNSSYHPGRVFEDWLEWRADSSLICAELSKLSSLDLTIFENQIRDSKYLMLIESCQNLLIKKLDAYWDKERSSLPIPKLDFKLKTEILSLDAIPRQKMVRQFIKAKQVVLTFDDGPHPEYTEKLLKILASVQVKATFFLLGKNVELYPEKVFLEANDGHTIGSHTHDHSCIAQNSRCKNFNIKKLSEAQSINEIATGLDSIFSVLGWAHPIFRFPYGESSAELQTLLFQRGFFDFYWSIDSDDWKKQGMNEFYNSLVQKVEHGQGGMILFHDIQKKTIEVMGPFLNYLHKNDYTVLIVQAKSIKSF